ncbi:zinc metalloproteinase-disintegrin-like VLAIP-A [Crassostrea angulata]|uniref:zinc metalloproteinase-disintegrin-like VLAIP-A n=1 Tax=Magallana angulata TaxID=2784310 RepID=UPI0022B1B04A|nr:zinc metalloproteinase-disintegrin-like VLAIP-A [Crassostrea angulata]
MFSSIIHLVFPLVVGFEFLVAMLPDFLTKEDMQVADVMVQVSADNDRMSRHSALPRHMLVSLNIRSDEIIFDLTENKEINSNVPIYVTDDHGNIRVQQIASSGNVKCYQDQKHEASFMIESNSSSSCMVAIFVHKGEEYVMRPDHCLLDVGGEMKFKLAKVKKNHTLDNHSLKSDIDRHWFSTEKIGTKLRHKRESTDYKIEMFFIIDYSIYNYWFTQSQASTANDKDTEAKNSIRQFYSFVVNGMDVRYKTIQSSYTISILYAGIYIADTQSKAQFVENNKVTSSSGTTVDSSVALDAVTAWIKNSTGIPQHDHAMLFTRYDLTSDGSSSNAGLAYLSAMCSDESVSVAEDHFNFDLITTAAHELGHGLGAEHDGTGNSCNRADSYIMAAVSGSVQNQNPWKFSTCSVNYFTTNINKLNQENKNCMTVLSPSYDPEALKQYTSLPGEIYDAHSHCGHIVGPGSSFCKSLYDGNFSTICTKLWCKKTDGSGLCSSAVPGDGLHCGNKKWCVSGECIFDECAPSGDEACLYGDREGVVITYGGKKFTCSFEDIHDDPSVCYHVKDDCCRQCSHFYTGITGCEYGDKTTGCTTQHCPADPSLCCGTCYSDTAITTPSQEPTTTKYVSPCKTTVTTLDANTTSTTPPSSVSTTTQIPATSTQQTMSQTSITSTTQQTTTSSPSSTPKILQTTAPTQAPSLVFRLDITLMIDISEDLSIAAVKENVTYKVQTALTLFYQINGLKFTSCSVQNIRKGSLKVEYEVQTPVDSQVVTNMTSLSKDMATGASKVTYEGQVVTVSSVTLVDTSGNSLTIGNSTTICEIHQLVSACPSGQLCEESNNGPVCRDTEEESIFEKYQIYFICVGAGLGLLVLILIVCCCLKNGKSKLKRANKNSVHGVTNRAMDDLYSQRKNNLHRPDRY